MIYLADKSGKYLAREGAARYEAIQWLMFQIANRGPTFGQVGFLHNSPAESTRTNVRAIAMSHSRSNCSGF